MQKSYDVVVVGAGLSGLLVAHRFRDARLRVALVDPNWGGSFQGYEFAQTLHDPSLCFLPDSKEVRWGLDLIRSIRPQSTATQHQLRPSTFSHNQRIDFAGFGEQQPACIEEISPFLSEHWWHVDPALSQVVRRLGDELKELHLKSVATQFQLDGERVARLTLNGQGTIEAAKWIWCAPISGLKTCLGKNFSAEKGRPKEIAGLSLDWHFSEPVDASPGVYVFSDESVTFVGRFVNNKLSQWLTFFDQESMEDPENATGVLKKMKRQLKRWFPAEASLLCFERVSVLSEYHVQKALKHKDGRLPELQNLWIGSSQIAEERGLSGLFQQVHRVLVQNQLQVDFQLADFSFIDAADPRHQPLSEKA